MLASLAVDLGTADWAAAANDAPADGNAASRQRRREAAFRVRGSIPYDLSPVTTDADIDATPASSDEGAFALIVEEHSAAVYRLARSVVRDPALADDVTQDTFIKVWKHLDSFRGESSLRSWILRIAHNTAVSTLRKIRDSATDPAKLPEVSDPIGTTRVVEGRIAADELRDALEELDELTRSIVVLREVEGMSYDDIASTLDVPIPTVKTRLLRARRRLATMLDEWRPDGAMS
jgi:RNA polymerase sigma-70 factor, ECF subfamily